MGIVFVRNHLLSKSEVYLCIRGAIEKKNLAQTQQFFMGAQINFPPFGGTLPYPITLMDIFLNSDHYCNPFLRIFFKCNLPADNALSLLVIGPKCRTMRKLDSYVCVFYLLSRQYKPFQLIHYWLQRDKHYCYTHARTHRQM